MALSSWEVCPMTCSVFVQHVNRAQGHAAALFSYGKDKHLPFCPLGPSVLPMHSVCLASRELPPHH